MTDDASAVRALLAAAGFEPREDELEVIAATYARLRPAIAALHDVLEAREQTPAVQFVPDPSETDWR